MRKELDKRTLSLLNEAGVGFMGGVDAPWGGVNFGLGVDELQAFVDDPALFYARSKGATKEEYLDWLENRGQPKCIEKTRSGTRCKNSTSGGVTLELQEWIEEPDGYCHLHGGPSREEARENCLARHRGR